MTQEEKQKAFQMHEQMRYIEAQNKKEYWKACGTALLSGELGMVEKWCSFVDAQADNASICGALLDELLQTMSMIKAGIDHEAIKQVVSAVNSQTLLDYLYMFVHPEIVAAVTPSTNVK